MQNLTTPETIGIIIIIAIFLAFINSGNSSNYNNSNRELEIDEESLKRQKQVKEKLEMMNLNMESLLIKKEETENEINALELESSMDFEKERNNVTKIKKLNLQGRHLDIKIKEMRLKVDNLKSEIGM